MCSHCSIHAGRQNLGHLLDTPRYLHTGISYTSMEELEQIALYGEEPQLSLLHSSINFKLSSSPVLHSPPPPNACVLRGPTFKGVQTEFW